MSLFTPVNQVKLTNVAVVRLKKGVAVVGKKAISQRFEIACYKNKVIEYRKHIETSIDEVLQVNAVFVNVSKGELAKKEDIFNAFGTYNLEDVCKIILEKGEVQIGDKERSSQLEEQYKEIANIVAEKCINTESQLPYPPEFIERAMHEMLHYSLHPSRNSKQQALDVIRLFQETRPFPIARAQMRISLQLAAKEGKKIREKLDKNVMISLIESEMFSDDFFEMICLIDPGHFRAIEDLVREETKGNGKVETISVKSVSFEFE